MKMTTMALAAAVALAMSPWAMAQVDINAPAARVNTGPAGTEVNAPNANVQTGPAGVDVNAAGVHVDTNRVGPNPSVNINVPQAGLNLNVPTPGARIDADGRPTGPIRNAIRGAVGANNNPDAWRYKYHNGEWWYYTPQNNWMYHRDNNWSAYDQGSYSYRTGYGPARRYETGYRGVRGRRYSTNPSAGVNVNAPGANVNVAPGPAMNPAAPKVNVDAGPGGANVNVNPNQR